MNNKESYKKGKQRGGEGGKERKGDGDDDN